jgi:four helix bundle protein
MGKGRLQPAFLERTEVFADRCLAVPEQLHKDGRFARVVEQLAASGCSVGANAAEASEAMSVKDFRKSLAVAKKELAETSFWLSLFVRRGWLPAARVETLKVELAEIKAIIGSVLSKTQPNRDDQGLSLARTKH